MARISLGGFDEELDSKKSRTSAVNMYVEQTDKGYVTFRGVDGLEEFVSLPESPIRSNFTISRSNNLYVVSGSSLFEIDTLGNVSNLGFVGGAGEAQIITNGVPADNQLLILNGLGDGYTYDSNGLVKITDANFTDASPRVGTILNEIFWVVKEDSNQFIGSAISDGTTWPVDRIATAEESPDFIVNTIAKRSNLYLLGAQTTERWVATSDIQVPVRVQKGGTLLRGCLAKFSLADLAETFAWLADDRTVRAVVGGQMVKISDLDLEQRLKGNGTLAQPKPGTVTDAIGFFVDDPVHKIYYLTFPTAGFTWGYDFTTGLSHIRETAIDDIWRVKESITWNEDVYGGDRLTGQIWKFTQAKKTEGEEFIRRLVRFPSISFEKNASIPLIELDMEVAQADDNAKLVVRYSKDGGYTYTGWGEITLGNLGNYRTRVPLRNFGRLVRHKDFVIELRLTDPARFQLYGAYADVKMGF